MQGALRLALAAAALSLAACKGERPRPSPAAASANAAGRSAVALDGGPLVAVAIATTRDASARAAALATEVDGCGPTPAYADWRRAVATAAPFVRAWAPAASEVLLGPERPGEGAGALARLDAALDAKDCAGARTALSQARRALTLAPVELEAAKATLQRGAEVLSDAAYELGLELMEASASPPATTGAAVADARGTITAIEQGAATLGDARGVVAALAPVREALDAAGATGTLADRLPLVRATGLAGAAVRALAARRGWQVRPPVAPLFEADEAISALTLPRQRARVRPEVAALGARLFVDAKLSRGHKRACAGCHLPSRAFADGLRVPPSLDATQITRNTPSLTYSYLAAAQRWDGRVIAPEDQALSVLHNASEMGVTAAQIEQVVRDDPPARAAMEAAFRDGVTSANVSAAIAAYVETLARTDARIDRAARGELELGADERAGFDVFVGKGRCARCHVPPSFGGSRPRDFQVAVYAVLGVPAREGSRALDADKGRGGVTGRPEDLRAFKTPTLREIAATAPYFHNGGFATLEGVVDFYDKGGGVGAGVAGITRERQDPDVRPLRLTPDERRALLVFLRETLR